MFEHYKHKTLKCLYLITLNGKKYVGQTNDTYTRFIAHRDPESGCRYIRNAIQLYGWENVKVEILLADLSFEEVNRLETHYIDTLGTLAPGGYNLKRGGDSNDFSDDSKKKMSETRKLKCEDPIFREALSESAKKRWGNPDYIEAFSVSSKKRWDTPGAREAQGAKSKEVWEDPAYKEAYSQMMRKQWEDPEYREKQLDNRKQRRKFTDEELIKTNGEFRGSNDKLSKYFGVSKAVVIKHKKRLELSNNKRKFTDEELLKIDEEFKGDVNKLSEYFQVVHCVIYKHRKRLGLSGKCYNK